MLREASLLLLLGVSIHKAIRFLSHLLNGNPPVVVDDSSNDDVSSSQMVPPPATQYDVFLSFRGEDTRHSFASYLYKGLRNAGIHTFMDHELHKGEHILPVLFKTIKESEISVIIFSENYASSTWCMNELVHILECKKHFGRVVIPIFYNVDASNIRKQKGSFGHGFDELKRRFKDNQEKLEKWRNALVQSSSLSGWDSKNTRPEFKFVEEIVKDILSKLNYKSSSHLERLVGITNHIENIEKLLNKASILGIWGMGGSGKTTLAKALFQELKAHFNAFSFVENVKEQLARVSLDELQKNCLKELLKDGDINIYDIKSNSVKSRLQRKKVLLVLDDVDTSIIAEDLIKVFDWFGEGSRIIITSRNEQVLKNAAFTTYHVLELDFHDAFFLFSLKAFKQHEPFEGYMELSKSILHYCQGNPLALVVLGCFLYGRGKEEWESALAKLNEAPPKDIVDVLKLSFDGLDNKQQNVFLDLAFLIKEGVCISMNLIRQLYGCSGDIEIRVLREKSLISFNNDTGHIEMHNLVRKMGLGISRQQLFSSPRTLVRLWRHEDIDYFFNCDKEIEAIRCLSLDLSKITRITWMASNFRKMRYLIFLKVYKSDGINPSELTICGDLDYLPNELRFFSWEECPLPNVPLQFCAENLIILEMRNSNIRQLWDGNQHFPNLKDIDLRNSKHLIALPDLSHAPKIENVYLDGCVNLAQIHSSNVLSNLSYLWVDNDGPRQINIGGSIKGTRSGLVLVWNYLDLHKMLLKKVRMKVLVCGNIIYGIRFKHVEMPLEEIAELGSLLPYVRKVEWLESPIEYGHDFKQYYDYDCDYLHDSPYFALKMKVRRRGDRGERRHVVGLLTRDNMIDENQREIVNDDQIMAMTTLIEVEQEEEEELTMEYYGSDTSNILTRVPSSITRWSLLKQLILRESDIVEDSLILKSLSFSYASCKPLLDLTLSLDRHYHFCINYGGDLSLPLVDHHCFECYVGDVMSSRHLNYDFVVEYVDWLLF